MEESGWPNGITTDKQKDDYIDEILRTMKIKFVRMQDFVSASNFC